MKPRYKKNGRKASSPQVWPAPLGVEGRTSAESQAAPDQVSAPVQVAQSTVASASPTIGAGEGAPRQNSTSSGISVKDAQWQKIEPPVTKNGDDGSSQPITVRHIKYGWPIFVAVAGFLGGIATASWNVSRELTVIQKDIAQLQAESRDNKVRMEKLVDENNKLGQRMAGAEAQLKVAPGRQATR